MSWRTLYTLEMKRLAVVLIAFLQVCLARADDTPAALTAIADTADRICGIVATQGGAHSSTVSGDVHAELSGLVRHLASIGVSGAGQIKSSDYQNVLQQDLPAALKDARDCKLRVFERLVGTVLPGVIVPSGAGAPSGTLLQSPSSAHLVEFIRDYWGTELGLHSCSNTASGQAFNIICYGIVTRTAQGQHDYKLDGLFPRRTTLVDNFHIEHRLRRGVFINGAGGRQQTANLSTGESIWWELEFEPGPQRASSGRIVIGNLQLRSPVY